jgi:hypothetical protein
MSAPQSITRDMDAALQLELSENQSPFWIAHFGFFGRLPKTHSWKMKVPPVEVGAVTVRTTNRGGLGSDDRTLWRVLLP